MKNLNTYLDAAILKPEMNAAEVIAAVKLCLPYRPFTLCVRPCDIAGVLPYCKDSPDTGLCAVLAFPHGSCLPASKADEAKRYIDAGVDEIDMVANIGAARAGDWQRVLDDIAAVSQITRPAGIPLKVIMETALLQPDEIRQLTLAAIDAHADFVKTSTGFKGPGASIEAVRIMLDTAQGRIRVKPSGGIRNRAQAEAFIHMGVHRLGVGFSSVPDLCDNNMNAQESATSPNTY